MSDDIKYVAPEAHMLSNAELYRRAIAYPRLVEALRNLRACISETRGKDANDATANADDLLRELGELK